MGRGRRDEPATSGREAIGVRVADAISAACHPRPVPGPSVVPMATLALPGLGFLLSAGTDALDPSASTGARVVATVDVRTDADALVKRLFEEEGQRLVRLVRLFVDDRNAAEDIVQEGFIRLARSASRIHDPGKAAPYLRSIVLNLARDHNRRGLVSLRHHLPFDDHRASTEDEIVLREDQQQVIDALRRLPHRQRDCLVLRYYEELGIDDIAETLGISRNSVKTHLRRGLAAMEGHLAMARPSDTGPETEP